MARSRYVLALIVSVACTKVKPVPGVAGGPGSGNAARASEGSHSDTPPEPASAAASGPTNRAASPSASDSTTLSAALPSGPAFELGTDATPSVKPPALPPRPLFRALKRVGGTPLLRGFVEVKREREDIWDTRYVWLEQNGTVLDGLLGDERSMPTKVKGSVAPDGAFDLRAAVQGAALLSGRVQDGTVANVTLLARLPYGAPATQPRAHFQARTFAFAKEAADTALHEAATYAGFIGERAVLLRVSSERGALHGELRLPRGEPHELDGTITQEGYLALRERHDNEALGALTLAVAAENPRDAAWAALVGVYEPTSGGERGFVALERNRSLEFDTRELGGERRVEPHFATYVGASCRFSHEWPVVTGGGVTELNGKLAALSMVALEIQPCDEPYTPTALRAYLTERTYRAAPVGKGLFGLSFERTDDGNGAHELVTRSCYLVDAERGRVLNLTRALVDPPRAAALVTKRLLAERRVRSLSELRESNNDAGVASNPAETVPIGDANVCPIATGVEVSFDPYVLGPWAIGSPSVTLTRAEAKGFFTSDPSIDAWLR